MYVHTETHIMKQESLCTYCLKIAVLSLLKIFYLNILKMPPFQTMAQQLCNRTITQMCHILFKQYQIIRHLD